MIDQKTHTRVLCKLVHETRFEYEGLNSHQLEGGRVVELTSNLAP